jgi:hypothetical protein
MNRANNQNSRAVGLRLPTPAGLTVLVFLAFATSTSQAVTEAPLLLRGKPVNPAWLLVRFKDPGSSKAALGPLTEQGFRVRRQFRLVAGVGRVRLMAYKFLDNHGNGSTSDAIECIDYAVGKGAKILNNSWSVDVCTESLYDTIVAARNAGVLFVASAGNGGADHIGDNNDVTPTYPCSYDVDNIVSVAAIDATGQLATFSNFGTNFALRFVRVIRTHQLMRAEAMQPTDYINDI